jgi:hypothetical protein
MQLQLKHLPFVFLAVAGLCLAGAFSASTLPPEEAPVVVAAKP